MPIRKRQPKAEKSPLRLALELQWKLLAMGNPYRKAKWKLIDNRVQPRKR